MTHSEILSAISRGRTDRVFDLMSLPDWVQHLDGDGEISPLQWFVYYNDTTALEAVLLNGGTLSSIDLNAELGNAAFFGHWKVCDFLLRHGADVNSIVPATGETPLHSALAKAGRPYYLYTVRLLVERGCNVNALTIAGKETQAFMRDVRTKGESPLHRAAAYADEAIIQFLIDNGANREQRDTNGDTPLTWASEHLRPGKILSLLTYGEHRIGQSHRTRMTSDHGDGWGNGMDWSLMGDYLPLANLTKKADK